MAARKSGTATATRKRSDSNGKAVQPKLGARAKRRYVDLKKELGAAKAKGVLKAASDKAVEKGDRIIRLEYLFDVQGMKMPAHAKAHYGKKDAGVGTFDVGAAPPRKRSGRGNSKTASARSSTRRTSSKRQTANPRSSGSRKKRSATGSSSSRSGSRRTRVAA